MVKISKIEFKKSVDREIKKFLKTVFEKLAIEFIQYHNIYPDSKDSILFNSEESLLLGLFNNTIIRNFTEHQSAIEFGSYNNNEFIGRSDLMVFAKDFELIVEAKKWIYDGKNNTASQMIEYIKDPKEQLLKYYHAERSNCNNDPYIMLLIFEYVNLKKYPDCKLKDYNIETSDGINYYAAYEEGNSGLMVYGFVK